MLSKSITPDRGIKKINCKSSHKTLIIIADPLTVLKINQYQITR